MKAIRTFRGERAFRIGMRTVHIGAIAIIFGSATHQITRGSLLAWAWSIAAISGLAIMSDDLFRYGFQYLRRWMFWATASKLALLSSIALAPQFSLYLLAFALVIGSVVSHMPGRLRYRALWGEDPQPSKQSK